MRVKGVPIGEAKKHQRRMLRAFRLNLHARSLAVALSAIAALLTALALFR
jgi:hypothetical protein